MAGRSRKYWLTFALEVVGAVLLTYGAWLIYQPAGFIVAGVLLIAIGVANDGGES